jgi:hypothetical protein
MYYHNQNIFLNIILAAPSKSGKTAANAEEAELNELLNWAT